jgi:sorting nexin-13
MVDLVGSHLELFRQIKTKVGLDVMASLSVEERDEKMKEAMLVSRELHPALISHESEYKVSSSFVSPCSSTLLKNMVCNGLLKGGIQTLSCPISRN